MITVANFFKDRKEDFPLIYNIEVLVENYGKYELDDFFPKSTYAFLCNYSVRFSFKRIAIIQEKKLLKQTFVSPYKEAILVVFDEYNQKRLTICDYSPTKAFDKPISPLYNFDYLKNSFKFFRVYKVDSENSGALIPANCFKELHKSDEIICISKQPFYSAEKNCFLHMWLQYFPA